MSHLGWLAPTALTFMSFVAPLLIAGFLHIEEFYCMIYMPVYMFTIPSMYILLVIYSLFNLWNTGWGTREKKAEEKSAEEQKEDARIAAEFESKAGVMETLFGQLKFGAKKEQQSSDKKEEKGSVDFSCGNILRCLCFTHEDPNDPNEHLEKIGKSLMEVNHRLSKIEGSHGLGRWDRRRSSTGMRRGTSGSFSPKKGSITGINEEDEDLVENQNQDEHFHPQEEEEENDQVIPQKPKRDDMINPYWIEDLNDKLKNRKTDDLSLEEKKFWETMIDKYLKPFDQIYTPMEEFKRETAKTKRELFEYRDSFIFSFLMINSFYVVLITMLRLQSPLKIPWTIFTSFDLNGLDGVHYTFDYNPPENMESPLVTISRTTIVLDILGLVFLLTFTLITTFQVFGMFLHRWQTCKYFSSK